MLRIFGNSMRPVWRGRIVKYMKSVTGAGGARNDTKIFKTL